MRIVVVLVLAALLPVSCSRSPSGEPAAEPGDSTAVDGWPEPVRGPAFAPDLTGPIENPTPEESAAWKDPARGGTLLVKVADATTGDPVASCNYHAFRHALTRGKVDRHLSPRVTRRGIEDHADGIHPFSLGRGFWRLRLTSPSYRNTWTPIFEIRPGEETRLSILMAPANRLVVTVLDETGGPLADGAVLLRSEEGLRAAMHIANGRAERLVDVDRLTIEIGSTFLEEYAVQRVPVTLQAGGTTEVEIRLRRR